MHRYKIVNKSLYIFTIVGLAKFLYLEPILYCIELYIVMYCILLYCLELLISITCLLSSFISNLLTMKIFASIFVEFLEIACL